VRGRAYLIVHICSLRPWGRQAQIAPLHAPHACIAYPGACVAAMQGNKKPCKYRVRGCLCAVYSKSLTTGTTSCPCLSAPTSRSTSPGQPLLTGIRDGALLCPLPYLPTCASCLTWIRTNKDLDPVPRHARKWGVTSFIAYWVSDAFK